MNDEEKDQLIGQLLQMLIEAQHDKITPDDPDDDYSAFTAKIYIKDSSLKGGCGCNSSLIKAFGDEAEAWYDETAELVVPILKEQCHKFNKIIANKTGIMPKTVEDNPIKRFEEMDDE